MDITDAINLEITGIGIILYSPFAVAHIPLNSDYLSVHYMEPDDVAKHVVAGGLVGFATGSPGVYTIRTYSGYPDNSTLDKFTHRIRLAVEVRDRTLIFRDLYDLLEWDPAVPDNQKVILDDGFYHLTVCSNLPESGRPGDNQRISIWFKKVPAMPDIRWDGVPNLC
jgi:hypothetical protein